MKKFLPFVLVFSFVFAWLSGCQREEDFVYPPLEAFAFDVKSSSNVVRVTVVEPLPPVSTNLSEVSALYS